MVLYLGFEVISYLVTPLVGYTDIRLLGFLVSYQYLGNLVTSLVLTYPENV